jgi:hypothetical protein
MSISSMAVSWKAALLIDDVNPGVEPISQQVAAMANTTRAWLARVTEGVPAHGSSAVRASCYVLISYWITDAIAVGGGSDSPEFSEIALYASHLLNDPENRRHANSVPPALRLLTEILLSSLGLTAKPFGDFLSQSISVLRREDPALEADASLMDKRTLLRCAGLLPDLPAPRCDEVRLLLNSLRLSATAQEVDSLLLHLECLTAWGTRVIDPEVVRPWAGEMLAGFAVQQLRKHDLLTATRLLRVLQHLASIGVVASRDDLFIYLCSLHRAHGPFGWYGPEAAELHKQSSGLLEDVEFYLPATLECLWTLAERTADNWRLFDRVPRCARPGE